MYDWGATTAYPEHEACPYVSLQDCLTGPLTATEEKMQCVLTLWLVLRLLIRGLNVEQFWQSDFSWLIWFANSTLAKFSSKDGEKHAIFSSRLWQETFSQHCLVHPTLGCEVPRRGGNYLENGSVFRHKLSRTSSYSLDVGSPVALNLCQSGCVTVVR